jgi:hypothetical protein
LIDAAILMVSRRDHGAVGARQHQDIRSDHTGLEADIDQRLQPVVELVSQRPMVTQSLYGVAAYGTIIMSSKGKRRYIESTT